MALNRAIVEPSVTETGAPPNLAQAYDYCARIARSHYENFTIASWLMPHAMRPHMYAIYAYARIADDFADEEYDLAKLDGWEEELDLAYAGQPRHPVFVALADTVRRFDIPRQPFADLLRAFRSDVDFKGFDTHRRFAWLCALFGQPGGAFGALFVRDPRRRAPGAVGSRLHRFATGQLLAGYRERLGKGRIYLPRQDLASFGYSADELRAGIVNPAFIALMRHEVEFARGLLRSGAALHELVGPRLRRDILMFAGGGLAILRAIERIDYDVFRNRPRLKKLDYVRLGWDALRGRVGV